MTSRPFVPEHGVVSNSPLNPNKPATTVTDEAVEAAWAAYEAAGTEVAQVKMRAALEAAESHRAPTGLKRVRDRCDASLSFGQCILPSAHAPLFGSLPHIMENGNLFNTGEALLSTEETK